MARARCGTRGARALALLVVGLVLAAVVGGCDGDPRPDPTSPATLPAAPSPSTDTPSEPAPDPVSEPSAVASPGTSREAAEQPARGLVYWAAPRARTGELQLRAEVLADRGTDRAALLAAVRTATSGTPADPDYATLWPEAVVEKVRLWWDGDEGYFAVHLARGTPTRRPRGMSMREAHLAIQQVVWTLQSVRGVDAPVSFRVGAAGEHVTDLFGIPATGPADTYPAADHSGVLARVNILRIEGPTPDGTVVVGGLAESFEATVALVVRAPDASVVVRDSATADQCCGRLGPWRYALDTSRWPPGDYVIEASTDDPVGIRAGSDGPEVDAKTLTIEE